MTNPQDASTHTLTPHLQARRQLAERVRRAILAMHSIEEMDAVLAEIRQGLLDQGIPLRFTAVNRVDSSVSPPTVVSHSMSPDGVSGRLETGAGTILDFWKGKEVVYRRDLSQQDPYNERVYLGKARSVVDVPFAQGTLAVNSFEPNAFSDDDIDLLQEMAGLLEFGYRRIDEIHRVEVRLRVREKVWQMQTADDIEEVVVTLREAFDELGFHYSSCGLNIIYLDHVAPGEHVIMAHNMTRGANWMTLGRDPKPLIVEFWKAGVPAYRRDLDTEDVHNEQPTISEYYGRPARSVIDVPFSHGTLALNSTEPNAFTEDQVALLQDLASVLEDGYRRLDDLKSVQEHTDRLEAEVEERRRAEQDLACSLDEKEVLLREVHHRVKNNMQVVCSLLSLRGDSLSDPQAIRSFTDSRAQIESMAMIHELLYNASDLGRIEGHEFLRNLCMGVFGSYSIHSNRLRLVVEATPGLVTVDVAIECGLIVHELVSNCLKHAFPDDRSGVIRVLAQPDDDQIALTVQDNGVGMPSPMPSGKSIGLRLVQDLTRKLLGTVAIESDGGTRVTVTFPPPQRLSPAPAD